MSIHSMELQPTKGNIIETIKKDLLDRNKDVWYFVRLCNSITECCSIAVDGKWGSGKTFFIKQVQLLLESYNPKSSDLSDEEQAEIKNAFSSYASSDNNQEGFIPELCIYYDAWENDNDEDPILSLVYTMLKCADYYCSFEKDVDMKSVISLLVDSFTGLSSTKLMKLINETNPLAELESAKETHALIEEFLTSVMRGRGQRMVLFIDELDRCRPEYAIRFLERIKHYFNNEHITFVFSLNTVELQHTIKKYYGDGFDACRYLDRFFDLRMHVSTMITDKYYSSLGITESSWVYDNVCRAVISHFGLSIREIIRFNQMTKIAAYRITHSNHDFSYGSSGAIVFGLCTIVPIIIGLKISNIDLYYEFVNGTNPEPFIAILGTGDIARGFYSSLLNRDETFYEDPQDGKTSVMLSDKLTEYYYAVFNSSDRRNYDEVYVGGYRIDNNTKRELLNAANLLSKYAVIE